MAATWLFEVDLGDVLFEVDLGDVWSKLKSENLISVRRLIMALLPVPRRCAEALRYPPESRPEDAT